MPDKEKATKMLGFRDENGVLVCPADVVDPTKSYLCHIGAEDGSYTPNDDEIKAIGSLLASLGLKGKATKKEGSGGTAFYNKKGVVICRMVEGKPKPKPEPEPEPPPVPEAAAPEPPPIPEPEPAPEAAPEPEAQETAEAVAEAAATVKVNGAPKKATRKRAAKKKK